jgi:hypothetical protein
LPIVLGVLKIQTFMPSQDYTTTASQLDNKRLGKQRVEAYQIIRALTGESKGWIHHPATKMWQGYEYELALYGLTVSIEFYERGFNGFNMVEKFNDYLIKFNKRNTEASPWFVNDELFRFTHKSNLLRKDPEHYGQFFSVPTNVPYVWPLESGWSFRLGTFKKGDNLMVLKGHNVYLTSKQVAELLGVSPKTISAYKVRGQMPAPDKEYGRTPLWLYDTIEKWRGEIRTPVIPN